MSDTVDQIKSRLDIVDVLSGYLKVQKAGANWKARCPFHNEKTPSFYISPERQSWHCFGCNKGGDMFSFVQESEGIEFVEAMRILAQKAGVQIPEYRPGDHQRRDDRQRLLAVAELAAKFFAKQLWQSNSGLKALAYLRERGLTDSTIEAWNLGWAPNDWRALNGFLMEQGHAQTDIVAAGMAIDKNGRPYDRFRSRIMFPINDANGQVVGFTGRAFGAEVAVDGEPLAKYVNTPQTAIYDKSRVIFGLDKAKQEIRKREGALLVEGNMDAILAWQSGVGYAVAVSGTALTPHHLRMLSRYGNSVDFCFDADQAGQTATRRSIGLALAQNFSVRIMALDDPECKDPADYVQKHGARFGEIAAAAKPALQYYYDSASSSYDSRSVEKKKSIIQTMGPLIRRLTSRVEQSHWIGQLALLMRTDPANVQADIAAVRDDIAVTETPEAESNTPAISSVPLQAIDPLSQELLALLARDPSLAATAADAAGLADPRVAGLIQNPERLQNSTDEMERRLIDAAHIRASEWYADFDTRDVAAQFAAVMTRLRERDLRARRTQLELEIRRAEQEKDVGRLHELLGKFQQFTQELQQLQNIQSSNPTI